jgi:ubiquinone/menaquinone biosynthesis C-methylase UbiE
MTGESSSRDTARRFFPEIAVGGFSRVDGTVEFYQRIGALVDETSVVVDLGAGRGAFADDTSDYRRHLRDLKPRVGRLIGLDVDEAVLDNKSVDEAHVISPSGRLPLEDSSVDLVLSDFVFEHVTDPAALVKELTRVVKPGGWVCARTPNRRGYIGIGARLVPNRWHVKALRRIQPQKPAEDTFDVAYKLNTRADLRAHFPEDRYEHYVYTMNNEPAYAAGSVVGWRLTMLLFALTPRQSGAVLYVFLRRR